jgi:hypothetical protein
MSGSELTASHDHAAVDCSQAEGEGLTAIPACEGSSSRATDFLPGGCRCSTFSFTNAANTCVRTYDECRRLNNQATYRDRVAACTAVSTSSSFNHNQGTACRSLCFPNGPANPSNTPDICQSAAVRERMTLRFYSSDTSIAATNPAVTPIVAPTDPEPTVEQTDPLGFCGAEGELEGEDIECSVDSPASICRNSGGEWDSGTSECTCSDGSIKPLDQSCPF